MQSGLGHNPRGVVRTVGGLAALVWVAAAVAVGEPSDHDFVEVRLTHKKMAMRVGSPAVILPGEAFPSVEVVSRSREAGTLDGELVRDDGTTAKKIAARALQPGQKATVEFEGKPDPGRYRLQLQFATGDRPVFRDAYYFSVLDPGGLPEGYSVAAHPGKDGKLVYTPDYRGNRIPDFSMVGYLGGAKAIPEVPVKVTLTPEPGDATVRIQRAIDQVSALPPDADGFRGAVLLKKGVYEVAGSLKIKASGVVVRGEGPGKDRKTPLLDPAAGLTREAFIKSLADQDGTILITGKSPFSVAGAGGVELRKEPVAEILDSYVPVGAVSFSVRSPGDLRVGDAVFVQRRGNEAWIKAIGMDRIPGKKPWQPRDTSFERVVTAINGDRITINAPIVTAIEKQWGGGSVCRYDDPGRITRVGIENLRMVQYCAPDPKIGLGNVRGSAVMLSNLKDAWIRNVVAEHFYDNGAFVLGKHTRNITIRDSSILLADEKYTEGYVPRYGFKVGEGGHATLHLVENCHALNCRHAFYVDYQVTGPNVFHNCVSEKDITNSEPHHLWSCGGLYDNVRGSLALMNR